MSAVFLARDESLDRRVVVKVLPTALASGDAVERFKREIATVASLSHPQIVPILAAGDVEGLPYFVMPYVEGESLARRLARGPLSVRETVSVLVDVARALAFAHERGVVHRDIKPGTSSSRQIPRSSPISASPRLGWRRDRPGAGHRGVSRAMGRVSPSKGHRSAHPRTWHPSRSPATTRSIAAPTCIRSALPHMNAVGSAALFRSHAPPVAERASRRSPDADCAAPAGCAARPREHHHAMSGQGPECAPTRGDGDCPHVAGSYRPGRQRRPGC